MRRADDEPCHAVRVQSGLELNARFFARLRASREEEADRFVAQSPGRECEGIGRRCVEPLRIVDRQDQRSLLGEHSQSTEDAERDRSALQPSRLRSSSQQRNFEGLALRVGKPPERSVWHVSEEITERGERQRDLGFDWPAREHLQSPLTGFGDAFPPERRIPDPDLTFDEQRDRSAWNCLQEVVNRIDLRLAPYDLQRRRHQPSSGSLIRSYSLVAVTRTSQIFFACATAAQLCD